MNSAEMLRSFRNDLPSILDCNIDKSSISRQVFEVTGTVNCLLYVKTRKHEKTNWGITANVINRLKEQNRSWFVVLLSSNQNNGYVLTEQDIDYHISNIWNENIDGDYKTSSSFSTDIWFNSLGELSAFLKNNISQGSNVDEVISNAISLSVRKNNKESFESDQHLKLKKLIAERPDLINLNDVLTSYTEYSYPSGDRVDVAFELKDDNWAVVEIELNGLSETMIGLFQAVKYRALQGATLKLKKNKGNVFGYLVALNIPDDVKDCANTLGVKTFEISETLI